MDEQTSKVKRLEALSEEKYQEAVRARNRAHDKGASIIDRAAAYQAELEALKVRQTALEGMQATDQTYRTAEVLRALADNQQSISEAEEKSSFYRDKTP